MMDSTRRLPAILAVLVLGCSPSSTISPASDNAKPSAIADDALVQFSLLAALAADDYVGGPPLNEVLASGDFGVGTFDRLDGEMIVLDGKIYQALADGTVRAADLDGTTPFAAVTYFNADGRIDDLAAALLSDLDTQLDRKLPHANSPYALRITGTFTELTLRSVPAQSPPFRPLVDVIRDEQVTWQHRNVPGTLVGLRCPAWVGTINVSGYHWHFLSDDRQIGGHVLDCQFDDGALAYDECTSVLIHLPDSAAFQQVDLGGVSQHDVDRIERQRAND